MYGKVLGLAWRLGLPWVTWHGIVEAMAWYHKAKPINNNCDYHNEAQGNAESLQRILDSQERKLPATYQLGSQAKY